MPVAAAIPALISAGGAVAGGLMGKKGSRTQTQTSTSTPTLSPELQQIQSLLAGRLTGRLNDGAARFEPMRVNARESVNRSYNALPNTITERLAQRGYGRSGTLGNALTQVEVGRAGALSDVEGTIQKMIAGDEDQTLQMMQQLLNSGRGISTTGSNVLPGSAAGGAFGGGIETLMALLINKDKLGGLFGGD